MRTIGRFVLFAVALAACSNELPHEAPYDPASPVGKQARARVTGMAKLQGEADHSQVAVHLESDAAAYEASTLKDGTYMVSGVAPGKYRVTFDARYYDARTDEITLEAGEARELAPVTLALKTASLAGSAQAKRLMGAAFVTEGGVSVVAERTASLRAAAAPADFRYAAEATTAVAVTSTTVSAADGGYSLELPAGRYRITFTKEGVASEDGGEVTVTGEQAVVTLEPVTLLPLTGFVKIAGMANGGPSYTLTSTPAVSLEISGFNAVEMKIGRSADGTAAGCAGYAKQPYKAGVAMVLPAEGANTVCVVFVGKDGAETDPALASIVYDQTPPALPLLRINGGAGYLNTNLLTLELSAVDATAGVDRMRLTTGALGAAVPEPYLPTKVYALPVAGVNPVEGAYTLWAQFLDKAGNASAPVSASVRVDATPPVIALSARDAGGAAVSATNQLSFLVRLDATDASPLTVQYSATGDFSASPVENYQALRAWTVTPPTNPLGEARTVYARVRDAAGNQAVTLAPLSVWVDTLAPTSPGMTLSASATSQATVGVNLTAVGASFVELSPDISFLLPVRFPYQTVTTYTFPTGDGTKTLYARFADDAGNYSPVLAAAVLLDQTAPQLASVRIEEGALTNKTVVNVALAAFDSGTGVDRMRLAFGTLAGKPLEAYASSRQLALPTDGAGNPLEGRQVLYAQFVDKAGNAAAPVSTAVTVDRTAPVVALEARDAAGAVITASNSAEFFLHLQVSDASGVQVQYGATSDFTGAATEDYQPTRRWNAAPPTNPDGEPRTVYVRVADTAGNATVTGPLTVFVDTLAPTAPSLTLAAATVSSPTVGVGLFAQGAAIVELSSDIGFLNPVRFAYRPATTYTFPGGDGLKTLYGRFVDASGNATPVLAGSAVLDQTPPQLAGLHVQEAGLTNQTIVHLDLTAIDAAAMQIAEGACGGTWVAFSATATLALSLGDGPKDVYARFRDAAGNATACLRQTVVLDKARPAPGAPAVVINGGGTYARERSVTLTLDVAGADEMRFSEAAGFAGSAWLPMAATANFTLSSGDAAKTVWAQFRDAAGNTTEATAGVILDTVGPEQPLVVVGAGNGYAQATLVGLTLSATGSPVYYRASTDGVIDNKAWLAYVTSASISLGAGADGPRTVAAQFRDAAGNTSLVASAQVFLDRASPAATTVRIDDGALYTSHALGYVTLNLGAVDTGAGLSSVIIAGSAAALATAPTLPFEPTKLYTLTLPGVDGLKEVWVTYGDKAGNYAAAVSGLITLDRTPPAVVMSLPNGTLSATNVLPVRIDAPADTAAMLLSNDPGFSGAAWQPFQRDVIWTFPAVQGSVRFYGKFRDLAGNTSPGAFSVAVTLDTVAPAVAAVGALVRSDTLVWEHYGRDVTGYSVLLYDGGVVVSAVATTEKSLGVGTVAPNYVVVAHYADGSSSLPSYPPGYFVPATISALVSANLRPSENDRLRGMSGVTALGSVTAAPCEGQVNLINQQDYYAAKPAACGKGNAVYFTSPNSWYPTVPAFTPQAGAAAPNPWSGLPFTVSGAALGYPQHAYRKVYLQLPDGLSWPMMYYQPFYGGQPVLVGGEFDPATLTGENFLEMTVPFAAAAVTDDATFTASPYAGSVNGYGTLQDGTFALAVSAPFAGFAATSVTLRQGWNMASFNGFWDGQYNGYNMGFPGGVQLPYYTSSYFDGANDFYFSNAQYYCTWQYMLEYPYYSYACQNYGTDVHLDTLNSAVHFSNASPYYQYWGNDLVVSNRDGTRSYRLQIPSNAQGTFRWSAEQAQPAFGDALAKMIHRVAAPVRVRGTGRPVLTSDVAQAYAMQVSTDAAFAGGSWQPYQSSVTLPSGTTAVWVRYSDVAGNVTPAQQVNVQAPTEAPRIDRVEIAGPNAAPGYSTSSNVTARLFGSIPAGSRVRYSTSQAFANAGWQSVENGGVAVALPPQAGRYWYYFWVADPSDNYSLPVSASVLFDGTPPQAEFSLMGGAGYVTVQGRYTVSLSAYQPSITDTVPLGASPMGQILSLGFGFPLAGVTYSTAVLDWNENCLSVGNMAMGMGGGFCGVHRTGSPVTGRYKATPNAFLFVWDSIDAAGTPVTSAVELNASGLVRLIYWRTNAHVTLASEVMGVPSPYSDWRYALAQGAVEYTPNPDGIRFVLRSNHGTLIDYVLPVCKDIWSCANPWQSFPVTDTGWTRWTGTAFSGGGAAGRVTVREVMINATTAQMGAVSAYPLSHGRYWVDYVHQTDNAGANYLVQGSVRQESAVVAGRDLENVSVSPVGGGGSYGALPASITMRPEGSLATTGAPVNADPNSTLAFGADGAIYDVADLTAPRAIRAVTGSWPFGPAGQAMRHQDKLWAANGVWDISNLDAPVMAASIAARASAVYRGRVYVATGSSVGIYDAANLAAGPINYVYGAQFTGPMYLMGSQLYVGAVGYGSASWYALDLAADPDNPSTFYVGYGAGFVNEGLQSEMFTSPAAGLGIFRVFSTPSGIAVRMAGSSGASYPSDGVALTARDAQIYRSYQGGLQIHSLGNSLPSSVKQYNLGSGTAVFADATHVYVCAGGAFTWFDQNMTQLGTKNISCNESTRIAYPWVYASQNRYLISGAQLLDKTIYIADTVMTGSYMPLQYIGAGYTDWNGNWRPVPEVVAEFDRLAPVANGAATGRPYQLRFADRDLVYAQFYTANSPVSASTITAMQYSGIVSGALRPPFVPLIADGSTLVEGRDGFITTNNGVYFVENLARVTQVHAGGLHLLPGHLAVDPANTAGRSIYALRPASAVQVALWNDAGGRIAVSPTGKAYGIDVNRQKLLAAAWGPGVPEFRFREDQLATSPQIVASGGFVYVAAGGQGLARLALPAQVGSLTQERGVVAHEGGTFTFRNAALERVTAATAAAGTSLATLCQSWLYPLADPNMPMPSNMCSSGSSLTADRVLQGDAAAQWYGIEAPSVLAGNTLGVAVDETGLVYAGVDDGGGAGHVGVLSPADWGMFERFQIGPLGTVTQIAAGGGYVAANHGGTLEVWRTDPTVFTSLWSDYVPDMTRVRLKNGALAYELYGNVVLRSPLSGVVLSSCGVGAMNDFDLYFMRWSGREHPVAVIGNSGGLGFVSLEDCSWVGAWSLDGNAVTGVRVQGSYLLASQGAAGALILSLADFPRSGIATRLAGGTIDDALILGGFVYTGAKTASPQVFELH
jgi:hypothetical protein